MLSMRNSFERRSYEPWFVLNKTIYDDILEVALSDCLVSSSQSDKDSSNKCSELLRLLNENDDIVVRDLARADAEKQPVRLGRQVAEAVRTSRLPVSDSENNDTGRIKHQARVIQCRQSVECSSKSSTRNAYNDTRRRKIASIAFSSADGQSANENSQLAAIDVDRRRNRLKNTDAKFCCPQDTGKAPPNNYYSDGDNYSEPGELGSRSKKNADESAGAAARCKSPRESPSGNESNESISGEVDNSSLKITTNIYAENAESNDAEILDSLHARSVDKISQLRSIDTSNWDVVKTASNKNISNGLIFSKFNAVADNFEKLPIANHKTLTEETDITDVSKTESAKEESDSCMLQIDCLPLDLTLNNSTTADPNRLDSKKITLQTLLAVPVVSASHKSPDMTAKTKLGSVKHPCTAGVSWTTVEKETVLEVVERLSLSCLTDTVDGEKTITPLHNLCEFRVQRTASAPRQAFESRQERAFQKEDSKRSQKPALEAPTLTRGVNKRLAGTEENRAPPFDDVPRKKCLYDQQRGSYSRHRRQVAPSSESATIAGKPVKLTDMPRAGNNAGFCVPGFRAAVVHEKQDSGVCEVIPQLWAPVNKTFLSSIVEQILTTCSSDIDPSTSGEAFSPRGIESTWDEMGSGHEASPSDQDQTRGMHALQSDSSSDDSMTSDDCLDTPCFEQLASGAINTRDESESADVINSDVTTDDVSDPADGSPPLKWKSNIMRRVRKDEGTAPAEASQPPAWRYRNVTTSPVVV